MDPVNTAPLRESLLGIVSALTIAALVAASVRSENAKLDQCIGTERLAVEFMEALSRSAAPSQWGGEEQREEALQSALGATLAALAVVQDAQ
jgi:hypothetical protein